MGSKGHSPGFQWGFLGGLLFDVLIEISKSGRRAASFPPLVLVGSGRGRSSKGHSSGFRWGAF